MQELHTPFDAYDPSPPMPSTQEQLRWYDRGWEDGGVASLSVLALAAVACLAAGFLLGFLVR